MLSIMFPMRTIQLPIYTTSYPSSSEKIYVLAKGVFGKDSRVKTTINEIDTIKGIIKLQKKTTQMIKYMELDELISSYPVPVDDIKYVLNDQAIFSKYKNSVLMYLVYREVLFKEEIIRILY